MASEITIKSELDEKIRNITEILQDKFPKIDLSDIPGFTKGDETTTTRSSNFALFMLSLILGIFWITYITLINARVVGKIITKIANRFVPEGYVKVGSFSWAVLPGKIMFRDVVYVTPDYTVRIQDGYVVFRWWRSYVQRDVSEDMSHSDTRLSVQLNGFEVHCYNRYGVYRALFKKFFKTDEEESDPEDENDDDNRSLEGTPERDNPGKSSSFLLGKNWRDLIPVIKIDMSIAKFAFGNRLLPTTLVIYFEEARFMYSTKPAACSLDHFMHFLQGKAENFKILLASSPKYIGLRDEAPRFMGEGFVVAATNDLDVYYYMDEAGVIPEDKNPMLQSTAVPEWGIDIKCGKATNFSYGPWADRQREHIYKFFFPPDFQIMRPTPLPKPGDLRTANMFRIRLSTQEPATLDVLFSKLKETKAVHVTMKHGTNFEVKIPWICGEAGYTTNISGTLMMAEATTSLSYRELLRCETLQIQVEMNYPLLWNSYQEWLFKFVSTRSVVNFIYAHKFFFQDLIDDWSVRSPPDLLYFVPYTWKFQFLFNDFELITLANEFNWIDTDTSSHEQENSFLGVCGENLEMNFALPYVEFLPQNVRYVFDIQGLSLDLTLFLPMSNTSQDILKSLDQNAKIATHDGKWKWKNDEVLKKWRSDCKPDRGWVDCWSAPKISLLIEFLYHPVPLAGPAPQADVPTPEKEKHLLSPLRAPSSNFVKSATRDSPSRSSLIALADNFEPDVLSPDRCKVVLRMESSAAFLYGTLIRSFMHVKENMFGEDQNFTPMDVSSDKGLTEAFRMQSACHDVSTQSGDEFDPRHYRPLEVELDIVMYDVQANLIKNCSPDDPPCPFLVVEKIVFELDKRYRETLLQLQLSPVVLRSGVATCDKKKDDLSQGHLLLTGLQFRGHAMFSELERPLGSDTLEYAWLIEIQCGSLLGKINAAQIYDVFVALEMFLFLAVDKENVLKHPRPFKVCQHNENQKECQLMEKDEEVCATVEELKYRLVRFCADSIDVYVVEKSSSLRIQACPIRFSTCNLHGHHSKQGMTALINSIVLEQYVNSNFPLSRSDQDTTHHPEIWIETAAIRVASVFVEGSLSANQSKQKNAQYLQHKFLKRHDAKKHNLWFLWPPALAKCGPETATKCGCSGGCRFFGTNEAARSFFQPSREEIDSRLNVAIPTVRDRRQKPAFGQSILHESQLMTKDLRRFKSLLGSEEKVLPPMWPYQCRKPPKLPFCPDFRTHKSSSSNTSGETPKHPKNHRSFSHKRRRTPTRDVSRLRSVSACAEASGIRRENQNNRSLSIEAEEEEAKFDGFTSNLPKASSLVEVVIDKKPCHQEDSLARAESLISDALSFYSLDGLDDNLTDATSRGSTRGKSARSPISYRTLSPTSTHYETATSGGPPSVCSASFFETASQGRSSSLSFDTATLQPESPPNLNALEEELVGEDGSATLSHSLSTHSFMSAMSETEDFGLVNLHMQINKPITESPLLMSSYISHLTQLRCSNWTANMSTFQGEEKSNAKDAGTPELNLPSFETIEEGFSYIKMESKAEESQPGKWSKRGGPNNDWECSDQVHTLCEDKLNDDGEPEDNLNTLDLDANASKSTIIVKFRGAIDVILSPVFLESVQRIFESLTPTFQSQHPISVVNHLHSASLDRVESKNTLKKEKSLDLQERLIEIHEPVKGKNAPKEATEMLRTFEKSISSFAQASIHLPQINFMVIQASVVEEMCAFSALDNVRDITCVSLLALGIQDTTFQFCKKSQSKKTVQMYLQRPRASYGKKKKSKYKIAFDARQDEPFTFESSETQKEEVLMTGSLEKVHAQLRRLRNDSSILKDAYITAIPHHKSKVFFRYVDVPKLSSFRSSTPVEDDCHASESKPKTEDSKLGFNMCECGFEGISIKVAKRSSNQVEDESPECETEETPQEAENQSSSPTRNNFDAPPKRGDEYDRSRTTLSDDSPNPNIDQSEDDHDEANFSQENGISGKHSTASGSVELRTSWFNFAAPPKTPISRKIDFTRLDWNLLSTASPSIDAWLGPIDRLQNTASHCIGVYNQRVAAVMASLMAESIDKGPENFPKHSKYDKLTALSRTLRDDPSCQLCAILVKYSMKMEKENLENNLKGVPPLNILRQGIVVLSRQWKAALYTPILIELDLRSRGLKNIYSAQIEPIKLLEEETNSEEDDGDEDTLIDVDNEEAALLMRTASFPRMTSQNDGSINSEIPRLSPIHFRGLEEKSRLMETMQKRSSVVESIESAQDQVLSFAGEQPSEISPVGAPQHYKKEETLYDWMRRLQAQGPSNSRKSTSMPLVEEIVATEVEAGINDAIPIEPPSTPQATKSLHLLDAHIIFEPLLSSLGLMPQQIQNLSLKNLGSNVSVLANIAEFRIDIVESEFGKIHRSRRSNKTPRRLWVDTDTSPEFLCEKVYVQLDFKKVTDIKASGEKVLPLYISRAQLKRHTSSLVNFSIDILFISQKINMPLLRLLNQIVTMHQNVKETNEELREKKPEGGKKSYMTHKKTPSGSSTSSNMSVQLRRPSTSQPSEIGPTPSLLQSYAESNKLSDSSSRKTTLQTPSPSVTLKSHLRNRPKSFAQKFRPNSRLAGMGYTHAESPGGVPEQQDSFVLTSAPLERITEEQTTVRCWKTMYNLLELYSTMPTTKTVQRHSLTPLTSTPMLDAGILLKAGRKSIIFPNNRDSGLTKTPDTEIPLHEMTPTARKGITPASGLNLHHPSKGVSFAKADSAKMEHTPVIVFGIAKIRRTKLMATLSGLKLEGEIRGFQSSLHYKEKIKAPTKGVVEASVMGNMQEATIVLLEGIPPSQQTVLKITIGRTNLLHGSQMWKTKDKNSGTMHVDLIQVEIPQHPVDLHSIVTRGTKELSSTLQEFRGVRILQRGTKTHATEEQVVFLVRGDRDSAADAIHGRSSPKFPLSDQQLPRSPVEDSKLIKPLVMQFQFTLMKFTISAALLPSLQAEYSMERVTSRGVTGSKAKFVIDLPKHTLSFATKIQENLDILETSLPSEASIDLPKVHVSAEYIQDETRGGSSSMGPDGSILSQGSYLSAEAAIGHLEHCLTTDLLNHLVFVQKVFMKEVNEVVQKMSGSDRPVPVWYEFGEEIEEHSSSKPLLFSVSVRLEKITITATTPANSGVRFETEESELQFSNRVENLQGTKDQNKIFSKAHIKMKLSLGQIIRDLVYYEAETQFQTQAYFNTSIQLRNAFQGETDGPEDKDVIYITLNRPLVFVQPVAVDRAILFWLSYKNAWEYWTEQRLNLNKEVLIATEQVLEKVPITQITSQLGAQHVGTLFLQLDVRDIGVCLPLSDSSANSNRSEFETLGAIIATVESSSISACSAGSMVSMGKFKKLCLRFSDDFNHSLDDWKPDPTDPSIMNLCLVSEGSYEVCSQTAKAVKEENAKWLLNIQWQMTGVDVHADSNIGKHLSALARTLTALTGEEEDDQQEDIGSQSISEEEDSEVSVFAEEIPTVTSQQQHPLLRRQRTQQLDLDLPAYLFEPSVDKNMLAKYLETEINEQAKIVEDLQKLGASDHFISPEIRKLQELQNIASKNFRQDLAQKLRRQKSKASYFKEKIGLGSGTRLAKSKSIALPSPTRDRFEFGQLKRIRSGEILSGSPDRETVPEKALNRSFDETTAGAYEDTSSFTPPAYTSSGFPPIMEADYEDSPHFPRDKTKYNISPTKLQSNSLSNHTMLIKSEPNVDFEFHVKIFVNSGKCVLHTTKEEEKKRLRKDRSFSGNIFDNSPNQSRKFRSGGADSRDRSSTRLRAPLAQDMTIFFIPGLDARVHYNSRIEIEETVSFDPSKDGSYWISTSKRPGGKKATLCAWMTLQSIPQETIITPNILEFLEQALEPIPSLGVREHSGKVNEDLYEDSSSGSHNGHNVNTVSSSFPVDVIVYFRMQSSTFRFSCVPVSRVECMLRLPSLDVVFSSKRADGDILDEFANNFKPNQSQSAGTPPASGFGSESSDDDRSRSSRADPYEDAVTIGGLSVTGGLNDFSLHVFHPYGRGRKNRAEEMDFSPLTSEEKRDSLRVNVAFVKFHISRSRRVSTERRITGNGMGTACVRFSTLIDIGSASFEYDMRRLSETLEFPKAWYRRALVRRLFLGELKSVPPTCPSDGEAVPIDPNAGQKANIGGAGSGAVPRRGSVAQPGVKDRRQSAPQSVHPDKKTWVGRTSAQSWETLVVFAVGFKELKVMMNMGNVMGNVEWISKNLRSEGRFSIGSTGHKNMYVGLGLDGLKLEAKAGIVGGSIGLGRIDTYCHLSEDNSTEPFHQMCIQLDVVEIRFDYMSTSVLMGRVSHLVVKLTDDWHVTDMTKLPQIFVQGDLSWDQFQMLISKSTTADLLKILNKLEEFFSQQFKSSKKLFSSLESGPNRKTGVLALQHPAALAVKSTQGDDVGHHRHWQDALKKISSLKIYTLPFRLPEVGCVLGGVIELKGKHISLACFHGINFKSKSWALFSLKNPSISFVSDAQEIMEDPARTTTVIQTLSFSLGQTDKPTRTHHDFMATVKKISRSVNYLPPIKSLSDWFEYAFKSSDMDEVQRFPTLSPSNEKEKSNWKSQQQPEDIFALPCLRMDLKTKHVQGENKPAKEDPKPIVDCTFVTDFDHHIFVTTDAEAFFFLHDLISSYVKEKQRVLNIQQQQHTTSPSGQTPSGNGGGASSKPLLPSSSPSVERSDKTSPSNDIALKKIDPLQNDWRDFQCNTWHLEPTVRFISWAGSQIEPYGIDFILQRLGFSHARTTIPKWVQRGCMDPLDKILSVIVLRTIQVVQEEKVKQN